MAAFIPGAGIVEVSLSFAQHDGELAVNVFGVDTNSGAAVSGGDCTQIAAAVESWFRTGDGTHKYRDIVGTGCMLLDVKARDYTTSTGSEGLVTSSSLGTDGGAANPNGITFALTARTGTVGRSFRGRTFLVGLTDNFRSATDPNVADATHVGNQVLAFDALIASLAAITLGDAGSNPSLCVLSRVENGLPRADIVATPITSYGFHDLFFDYQRRRAPGHNRHHHITV